MVLLRAEGWEWTALTIGQADVPCKPCGKEQELHKGLVVAKPFLHLVSCFHSLSMARFLSPRWAISLFKVKQGMVHLEAVLVAEILGRRGVQPTVPPASSPFEIVPF